MTLDEFEQYYADFLASLAADPDQFEENWPRLPVRYICDGEGCPQSVDWIYFNTSLPADNVWRIWCGPCSAPIHNIDPMLSDEPDYRLPTTIQGPSGFAIPWGF